MPAQIRSSIPAKPTVDNASRDDLAIGDVVTLEAVPPPVGTTFQWTLVFVPEGSAAVLTPPAAAGTSGPVDFTVDLEGPYLVRLTVDAGLPTEDTQYVRLRALTATLGLKLVAAGERRDSTGTIPVDVDIEGWANEQNFNLQAIEAAIGAGTAPLDAVLTVGNTTGGTNIEVTTGDSILGQTDLTMSANGNVDITAVGAGADIVLNPDAAGSVVVNGKLTVTGLIDPTGLVLTQAAYGSTVPVPSPSEGTLFVNDGSFDSNTQGDLYYTKEGLTPGSAGVVNQSASLRETQIILSPLQLENTGGGLFGGEASISPATLFALNSTSSGDVPNDGAAVVLNDGSNVETYTFRTAPAPPPTFDVQIGSNFKECIANLVEVINRESVGWTAQFIPRGIFNGLFNNFNGSNHELALIVGLDPLGTQRIYLDTSLGTFPFPPVIGDFRPTDWGYQYGIRNDVNPPTSDPGTDNFGYRETSLVTLGDGQIRITLYPLRMYVQRIGGSSFKSPEPPSIWHRVGYTPLVYQRDVPPGPNTTVIQRGWASSPGRVDAVRVFMQTLNTQGNYTATFTKVTGTSTGTILDTASFDMNTLSAATVTDLDLTTIPSRQYFEQGDQWSAEFTSDDPNFDGTGIYFEILFGPEEISP